MELYFCSPYASLRRGKEKIAFSGVGRVSTSLKICATEELL
jgi:hypothetical protein